MGADDILTIADLKAAGSAKLPQHVQEYYNQGASDLITVRENEEAYNRLKIRTRILTDVSNIDTSTTILGEKVPLPFGFSPTAMHCLAHPDGEKATSRAAAARGIPMGLSLFATTLLEDVIKERGSATNPYGFQMSVVKSRENTLTWIKRAEAAGYKALFVTVDSAVPGIRLNQIRNDFKLPSHLSKPNFQNGLSEPKDTTNNWDTVVPWLRENTKLEIWLKGITTPEDAQLAVRYKVDGIIVSNHGGRQLDGVPATIEVLPEVVAVAKGRVKIAIDGGIRRGSDIFKALALGADFVFMGRVALWGLAYDGQKGVELAIKILESELRTTMALAGCASLKDITPRHISILGPNGRLSRL